MHFKIHEVQRPQSSSGTIFDKVTSPSGDAKLGSRLVKALLILLFGFGMTIIAFLAALRMAYIEVRGK